jgi:hypothetical protein
MGVGMTISELGTVLDGLPTDLKSMLKTGYRDTIDMLLSGLISSPMEEDYYKAPGSTRFHGCFEGGLALHSLEVLRQAYNLLRDPYFSIPLDSQHIGDMIVACLLHDYCKVNMYTVDYCNQKDESGQWKKVPYYRVRDDYVACGHGGESMLRIMGVYNLSEPWARAVYYHMGSFGLSSDENLAMLAATRKHKEVLLLHTADMLASQVMGV